MKKTIPSKHFEKYQNVEPLMGPYAGMCGILQRRTFETDTRTGEREPAWFVDFKGDLRVVYEREL